MFFIKIVILISVVEALEGPIEIVKRKRIAAILKKNKAGKGIGPVYKGI